MRGRITVMSAPRKYLEELRGGPPAWLWRPVGTRRGPRARSVGSPTSWASTPEALRTWVR